MGGGSEFFGKDGRKENGGWERGAEGLRREMGFAGGRGIEGWLVVGEGNAKIGGKDRGKERDMETRKRQREMELAGDEKEMAALKALEAEQKRIRRSRDFDDQPRPSNTSTSTHPASSSTPDSDNNTPNAPPRETPKPKPIFRNCTFYLNACTNPYAPSPPSHLPPPSSSPTTTLSTPAPPQRVSDHRLRALLIQHGASISLNLARRKVTHVVISTPCSHDTSISASDPAFDQSKPEVGRGIGRGVGGGLAAGKIQKEVSRKLGGSGGAGAGVRYVGVEWVLECIRVGKIVGGSRKAGGEAVMGMGKKGGIEKFFGGNGG